MIYGYARVSTDSQSVDAQVRQFRAAGVKQAFKETARGAKADRAQLRQVVALLGKGDVLMVTRLDCLPSTFRKCAGASRPHAANKTAQASVTPANLKVLFMAGPHEG